MTTKQMNPFFYLLFEPLLFKILILASQNCQNSFSWGLPNCSILVCKIPEFCMLKIGDQNFVPFDSGNIHIEEKKQLSCC